MDIIDKFLSLLDSNDVSNNDKKILRREINFIKDNK